MSWRSGFRTNSAVYGYGVRISVDRGRLVIEDGFANEGERRRTVLSRGTCQLQRLVILSRSGVLTLDAVQWLMDMGVAVLFIDPDGKLTSTLAPGGLEGSKVRLHRAQAAARDSEDGVKIARMLIGQKLRAQLGVLQWLADPGRQVRIEERERHARMHSAAQSLQGVMDKLQGAHGVESIVEAERAGAETYWRALSGIPLRWVSKAAQSVPPHWLYTQPRESYRTGNRYGASDPVNALLNYGYTLLEAETRIACLKSGLHPGLGIFHADKDGRASFVYDAMEPLRPTLDQLVLKFTRSHVFHEGECWETREGFCRLDPHLAGQVTAWVSLIRPDVKSLIRTVVHQLEDS